MKIKIWQFIAPPRNKVRLQNVKRDVRKYSKLKVTPLRVTVRLFAKLRDKPASKSRTETFPYRRASLFPREKGPKVQSLIPQPYFMALSSSYFVTWSLAKSLKNR